MKSTPKAKPDPLQDAADRALRAAARDARSGNRELTSGRYRPEPDAAE